MNIRICIDVDDLERAIEFYTQGLQLRLGRRLGSDWAELLGAGSSIDLLCEKDGSPPLGADHPQRRDDPWGHGFDLLEFRGRGYDEMLSP